MSIAESFLDIDTAAAIYNECGYDPLGWFDGESDNYRSRMFMPSKQEEELDKELRALTEELQKKYPSPHRK
jgi:hypothetical protein